MAKAETIPGSPAFELRQSVSLAGIADAVKKSSTVTPSPGRAAAGPSKVPIQADIDEQTRNALALSAAERLGSSARQDSLGSGRIGAWQEPVAGGAAEKVHF